MRTLKIIHPGEHLAEELQEMGLSAAAGRSYLPVIFGRKSSACFINSKWEGWDIGQFSFSNSFIFPPYLRQGLILSPFVLLTNLCSFSNTTHPTASRSIVSATYW